MSHRTTLAVLALPALLALSACKPAAPPAPPADAWAVVDGRTISAAEVDKAFDRNKDPQQTLSPEETLGAKLTLLDDLITQDILLAKAKALMIDVSQADLDKAYTEAQGNLTGDQFQQQLTARNMTAADVRESLRRDLVVNKVLENQVTAKAIVTDQEVTDFFNANKAQFNLTEDAYHLAQIIVTPVKEQQIANTTGDDAATPQAAQAKVAMLMQRLMMGASFPDLARQYSEDVDSAPRGGDLGLIPLSAVKGANPALRDAVLQMMPGRARVVNEGGAAAIVLLVSTEKAGQRDLSTPGTKDQISQGLKSRKEQLLRVAYLAALRNDAKITNYAARRVVESNGKV